MITTVGLNLLPDLWSNTDSPDPLLYIAFGTDTTAAALGDTALGSETDRQLATLSHISVYDTLDTMRYQYLFSIASNVTIGELGVFTAAAGGSMVARWVLSPTVTALADSNFLAMYDFIHLDGGAS
jgi:hypothetical protein